MNTQLTIILRVQLQSNELPLSTGTGAREYPQTRHLKKASLICGIIELHWIIIPLTETILSTSTFQRQQNPLIRFFK